MKTTFRMQMQEIMKQALDFIKRNGFSKSEALRVAWMNYKLHCEMVRRIVRFTFQKVDGSLREAYGTLQASVLPETQGSDRKRNDTVQTYFDTEKGEYRCFKKANLMRVTL